MEEASSLPKLVIGLRVHHVVCFLGKRNTLGAPHMAVILVQGGLLPLDHLSPLELSMVSLSLLEALAFSLR